MNREYTNKLLEMVEEGLLDKDTVIMACVKYMSEDDVRDMMEANEFLEHEEEDDDEEDFDRGRMYNGGGWGGRELEDDDTFIDINKTGGKW